MLFRRVGIGGTCAGFAAAVGFMAAFLADDREVSDWLFFAGAVLAVLIVGWTAGTSHRSISGTAAVFLLALLLAVAIAVVLAFGFGAVECQGFDNCLFD